MVEEFLAGAEALEETLGCLLVQLPPSLEFDAAVASAFFGHLRGRVDVAIACEPRHPSWLQPAAEALLREWRVARVAADPDRPTGAAEPGGWPGLVYYRLHGSPRMYYSSYAAGTLQLLAERLAASAAKGTPCWCIFDNTAGGAAAGDALELLRRLSPAGG